MALSRFGIYVHIPYCRQLCPYCDFTKYAWTGDAQKDRTLAPDSYVELVRKEIRTRASQVPRTSPVDTVYFGGGTPSLLEPSGILSILDELANQGLQFTQDPEITIEIDPATCNQARLDRYLEMGINRFSVGAQSFNDRLLKIAGRHHTSQDTVELLELMRRNKVNYSFDLLFALPTQSLAELGDDVARALEFSPSHLSAYCLTVPEGHKMAGGRAPEEEQVEMFDLIESKLANAGLKRYEISNFARPGFESRHNSLYWTDQSYWGVGLSSHSYFNRESLAELGETGDWGARFWNTRAMKKYADELEIAKVSNDLSSLPPSQIERLQRHQALTDYLHTGLRPLAGFDENALRLKFGEAVTQIVLSRLERLRDEGLIQHDGRSWQTTRAGRMVANLIFEKLTFLEGEDGPQ